MFRVAVSRCALAVYLIVSYRSPVGVAVCVKCGSAISNHAGCRACGRRVPWCCATCCQFIGCSGVEVERATPPPLLKGYNAGGQSQGKSRTIPTTDNNGVGEPTIIAGFRCKSSPKLPEFAYPSYPNATGRRPPAGYQTLRYAAFGS